MTQTAPTSMPAPVATGAAARFDGEWVIDVRNVDKQYKSGLLGRGRVHALRGIDMRVHRGSVFGLLGPNGAGKSTLVKILMTVIRATRCDGTFLGAPVGDKATLRRVGYLPEHHRFPDYLTAAQVLDFYGALSDVPRADRRRRSRELLELVGLTNWSDKKVRVFSKGMRQRLGIANTLMSDPDLVVLDEPTDGVDPVGRRDIRNILARLRDERRTVFLNSHLLSELEMVCDRVAILVQGVVSSQGTIEELTRHSRRYEIEVGQESPAAVAAAVSSLSMNVPLSVSGAIVTIRTDDPTAIQPALDALRARDVVIRGVRPARASLEDLFMQAVTDPGTGRAIAPGAASAARGEAGNAAREGLGIETGARS
ncbi:MAG: ABC transporter ATP-binding protein [Phycisphaeraceae bacterium]|nr:ABC transporter ATP-binding protein [Phycisphaeraceae bacterium]